MNLFYTEAELDMNYLTVCQNAGQRYYWNYYEHVYVSRWQETMLDEWLNDIIWSNLSN